MIKNINLIVVFISLGVFLRLNEYFHDKSVWRDEVYLLTNLQTKSFVELLQALDFNQGAFWGFLVIEKFILSILGDSGYSLRLFSLICGIISIFLFYKLVSLYLDKRRVLLSLALFSISYSLIYYSAELKPYSLDVLCTLLLLLLTANVEKKKLDIKNIIIFGFYISLVAWFSYPSVFVTVSIIIVKLAGSLVKKNTGEFKSNLLLFIFYSVNLLLLYFFHLSNLHKHSVERFEDYCFMPSFSISYSFLKWFYQAFSNLFNFIPVSKITLLFFVFGCISLFVKRRVLLFFLLTPLIITLIASSLHVYPFTHRLLLFYVPIAIILLVEGLEYLNKKFNNKILFIIFIIILFYKPILTLEKKIFIPTIYEDVKIAMDYLKTNLKEKDIIYVHLPLQFAFSYYEKKYKINCNIVFDKTYSDLREKREYDCGKYKVIIGEKIKGNNLNSLSQLNRKKRVWLLFSTLDKTKKDANVIVSYLNSIGSKLDEVSFQGVNLYLYDF